MSPAMRMGCTAVLRRRISWRTEHGKGRTISARSAITARARRRGSRIDIFSSSMRWGANSLWGRARLRATWSALWKATYWHMRSGSGAFGAKAGEANGARSARRELAKELASDAGTLRKVRTKNNTGVLDSRESKKHG